MPTLREAERRHATHYASVLQELQEAYRVGDHDTTVNRFEQDWGQFRKGQAWAAAELDRGGEDRLIALLYHTSGSDLLRLRRSPSERIRWLDPVFSILSELGDHGMLAEQLNLRASAALDQGKVAEAVLFYERALAEVTKQDAAGADADYVTQMHGGILRNLAAAYQRTGRFEEAVARYEQNLAVARSREDRLEESSILGNLGIAYAEHDDDERAISYYRQALDIAAEIPDDSERGMWLGNLGNSYVSLGRLQEGIDHLEEALTIARARGDRGEEGVRLGGLGAACLSLEQPERAREYIEQALTVAREMGSTYSEAVELHFLEVIQLDTQLDDLQLRARHIANLADVYHQRGKLEEARERYTEALAILDPAQDRELAAKSFANLGAIDAQLGRLAEARRHYQQASEAFAAMGMTDLVERVQHDLAHLPGAPRIDARTASDLRLFLATKYPSGSVASLTIVLTDGSVISVRLLAIALGPDFPELMVALSDGRTGRLDLSGVSAVTVQLTDGTIRVFGEQ